MPAKKKPPEDHLDPDQKAMLTRLKQTYAQVVSGQVGGLVIIGTSNTHDSFECAIGLTTMTAEQMIGHVEVLKARLTADLLKKRAEQAHAQAEAAKEPGK